MKPGDKIYWKLEALEDYQERFCIVGWTPETLGVIIDMDCSEMGSHIEGIPYDWCIESVDGDVLTPRVYVFESDIVSAKGQIPLPLKFKKKKRGESVFAAFNVCFGGGGEVEEVEISPPRRIRRAARAFTAGSTTPGYLAWITNNEDSECEEEGEPEPPRVQRPLLHNLHVMSERSINRTVLNPEDEREEDELF